jgi:hypothetical protein
VKIIVQSHSRIPLGMVPGARRDPEFKMPKERLKELPKDLQSVRIPERYADPSRSGVERTVQGGRQICDLALQP